MDPTDKQWDDNADMKAWRAWMSKYNAGANLRPMRPTMFTAYAVAVLMHETLKKCGDDLTRENLMKQAANFQKFRLPLLLPGITVSTSPTDYYPIQAVQLSRFKGETWELFGDASCRPKAPDPERSSRPAQATEKAAGIAAAFSSSAISRGRRRLALQRLAALGGVDAAVLVDVAAREVALGLGHELGEA